MQHRYENFKRIILNRVNCLIQNNFNNLKIYQDEKDISTFEQKEKK